MELNLFNLVIIFINLILNIIFIKIFLTTAHKINFFDNQNPHYNHQPTITGGGIVFLFVFTLSCILFLLLDKNFVTLLPNRYYVSFTALVILTLISFKDDQSPIDPRLRLILQIILIYLSLTSLDLSKLNLPIKLSFLVAVGLWIYIMNIINFIDGSDGFLTVNSLFFWSGVLFISKILNLNLFSEYLSATIIPLMVGFIIFNKPKAKIFMGDTGSIFLGFLIGFAFLELATAGQVVLAIALLIYPLLDCTICLLKKTKNGIMPWVGMYDYFFLIPTLRNKVNHLNVLIIITIFNLLNLFFIYLTIIIQSYFVLILNFLLSICVLYIFKNITLEKKMFKSLN
jgi:UDP-N-acetylmuramyl pentapeptide phosphotransferase/UDP-N-acetylglucosamine-1-phosphate transferase